MENEVDQSNQYLTTGSTNQIIRWQMRSSLKDQLSLEDLRKEFEKFADSKIARELPDFYKACLDREEIEDFFERQAATTAIIDRWDNELSCSLTIWGHRRGIPRFPQCCGAELLRIV